MGMFDKDKEIGLLLTGMFAEREEFILWHAGIVREDYPTKLGPAAQSELEVSRLNAPGDRFKVTTLAGAISAKVREATPDDFPVVVFWMTVDSQYGGKATVLQFMRPWGDSPTRQADAPAPDSVDEF